MVPTLSLVVATRGRDTPFQALFESLDAQTFRAFEVIVVDQNADDRVGAPADEDWSFPIKHLRTPTETGLSRARNSGLVAASGGIVLFPDDDCWYPPHFLAHAMERMRALGADVLAGRASDESGRDINGRFEQAVTRIDRRNVWTTGIEWVVFFRRAVLDGVGGYDTDIGVGAPTPWQACEGQDIMLRALAKTFACWFDPSVYGHHAELDINDPVMIRKGRGYARGLGYVLRLHGASPREVAKWLVRPGLRAGLSLVQGKRQLFLYYANIVLGRWEGWRMRVGSTAPAGAVSSGGASPRTSPRITLTRS